MFNTKFVSNCTLRSLDEIKLASLYYDSVDVLINEVVTTTKLEKEIVNGIEQYFCRVRGVHHCATDEFIDNLKLLEEEGVVRYEQSEDYTLAHADAVLQGNDDEPSDLMKLSMRNTSKLLHDNLDTLWFFNGDGRERRLILNEEARQLHSLYVNELDVGSTLDFDFLHKYYSNAITYLLYYIMSSNNAITNSNLLNDFMRNHFLQSLKQGDLKYSMSKESSPSIAMEALRMYVPNVSSLSIEDILEVRYKLRDELVHFRKYSLELNKTVESNFSKEDIFTNTSKCVETMLVPAVNDLQAKFKETRLGITSNILDELKNPSSYAPLLGNIFMNIPAYATFMLSAGLITGKALLDYKKEISGLKQNGVYYLLKLNS